MSRPTRRDCARGAALATAASYSKIMGANDRVRMGYSRRTISESLSRSLYGDPDPLQVERLSLA